MKGSADWATQSSKSATVGSAAARVFHVSDAGLGSSQEGDVYRVFHSSVCYELSVQEATINAAGFDPGSTNEFTRQDEARVLGSLRQAIDTFTFTK